MKRWPRRASWPNVNAIVFRWSLPPMACRRKNFCSLIRKTMSSPWLRRLRRTEKAFPMRWSGRGDSATSRSHQIPPKEMPCMKWKALLKGSVCAALKRRRTSPLLARVSRISISSRCSCRRTPSLSADAGFETAASVRRPQRSSVVEHGGSASCFSHQLRVVRIYRSSATILLAVHSQLRGQFRLVYYSPHAGDQFPALPIAAQAAGFNATDAEDSAADENAARQVQEAQIHRPQAGPTPN